MTESDPAKYAPGVPASEYGFQGNADAYGLGIRAGYYIQAFTVWAANFFVPHEAPFLHSVNIMFMFAMLAGLICLVSKGPGEVWAVEPFMLLNITYSVAWMGTCNPLVRESLPWEWTVKTGLVRQVSFLCLDIFAMWYWFPGLSMMKPTIGDMGTEVYFYTKGPLYGGIRIANQIITILDIIYRLGDLLGRGAIGYQDRVLERMTSAVSLRRQAWRWMPHTAMHCADTKPTELEKKSAVVSDKEPSPTTSRTESFSEKSGLTRATTVFWSTPTIISRSSTRRAEAAKETDAAYHPTREALSHAEELFDAVVVTTTKRWYHECIDFYSLPVIGVPSVLWAARGGRLRPRLIMPIIQYLTVQSDPQTHQFVESLRRLLRHPAVRRGDVDWRALALIMRFRVAIDPPPPAPRKKRVGQMIHCLTIAAVLAIGTELTIQWNYIRGVQQFGAVGQLIPLSLGVGGLLKVVWGAFAGDKDWCGKSCALERKLLLWRDPAVLWDEAKVKPVPALSTNAEKMPENETEATESHLPV